MARKKPKVAGEKQDRSKRILDAADALFCESGFDGTSLRDVAEAAGVNKGLILYYYENKAGLFTAVLQRYYESHQPVLEKLGREEGPLRERVHGMLDGYFEFISNNRRYARLIQQEVARAGKHLPRIRKNLASLFQLVGHELKDALPSEGPLAAKQFFLTLSGMTISYFTYAPALRAMWGEPPLSAKALGERREHMHWVVDCMLDGLGVPK
jgi:AcrR family transcriptional regulator